MNIEDIREYCLSLPLSTEDMPFEPDGVAFRVLGKIFAYIDLNNDDYFCLKCNAQYALELREKHHNEIAGAFHWNKKYWNQVSYRGALSDSFIKHLIRHSYREVVGKLPKRIIGEHRVVLTVEDKKCFN